MKIYEVRTKSISILEGHLYTRENTLESLNLMHEKLIKLGLAYVGGEVTYFGSELI